MNKLALLVVLIALTITLSAQSKSYRIYDEFSGRDGFTFMAFSKSMIDAVNLNIDEENKKSHRRFNGSQNSDLKP